MNWYHQKIRVVSVWIIFLGDNEERDESWQREEPDDGSDKCEDREEISQCDDGNDDDEDNDECSGDGKTNLLTVL